jgi:hypothetical protein
MQLIPTQIGIQKMIPRSEIKIKSFGRMASNPRDPNFIHPACKSFSQDQEAIEKANRKPTWREKMLEMATDDETINKLANAKFAYRNLIVQGQATTICARANGGKTTLAIEWAGAMAKDGYDVDYVNVDAGAGQLKDYHAHAKANGYNLIVPGLKDSKKPEDVLATIRYALSDKESDLSTYVMFLDTLKKFTELMDKKISKEFYALLRDLTKRGGTVISLAHVNKHNDMNTGKAIYQGTSDTRDDVDCLIYLNSVKNADGSMTITTDIDKDRFAGMKNETFTVTATREIIVEDQIIDVKSLADHADFVRENADVIYFVEESLKDGSKSITELHAIAKVLKNGFSQSKIRDAILEFQHDNKAGVPPKWKAYKATKGYSYAINNSSKDDLLDEF